MLPIRRPQIKQRPRVRAARAPDLQHAPALALGADVVPVVGGLGGGVGADGVEEVGRVGVH